MAQFGQVAWHSPGAAIGPDSGPEVALGVTWGTLGTYWSCPVSIDT